MMAYLHRTGERNESANLYPPMACAIARHTLLLRLRQGMQADETALRLAADLPGPEVSSDSLLCLSFLASSCRGGIRS